MNVGASEILIVLVIALLVLGPNKLPDAAKQLGKAISEFKKISSGLEYGIREAVNDADHGNPTPTEPANAESSAADSAGN